ncbi:MAG: cysteine-rich CWC family protein [Planctomycetota bacterium]
MPQTDLPLALAPSRCPLCGGFNRCAIAQGQAPKACWCMSVTVPASLLEQLPSGTAGKSCICGACVEAWNTRGVLRRYAD